MKNLIMPLLILISANTFSQESRGINWQQFTKSIKATEIAKPVPVNQFTTFQIDDINKFLYNVEIAGKVFELQTPIPTELETLFRIKSEDRDRSASQQKSKDAVENVSKAIPPMQEVADQAKMEKDNQEAIIATESAKLPAIRNQGIITKAISAKAENSKIAATANKLVSECIKYLELAKTVSKNVFLLKSTRNKLVSIAQMDLPKSKIDAMVSSVKWPIPNIENDYIELQELYKTLELLYSELAIKAKAAGASDESKESIQESSELIEKANDLIEQDALLGLLSDVDFLYNELRNPNNFVVVAPPVQMDGDYVAYTVNIVPSSTASLSAHRNPVSFKFAIPTMGGLKVDFSVGPVIAFGAKAKDEKYYLEEVNADTVYLRKRSNNNSIIPGIAAMMHFYERGKKFGGMFGIGAGFQSSNELNANLFLGGSAILGKREKLMLSVGVGFLRVDRLKDKEFVEDKKYNTPKIDLGNVTEKVFKPSVFFSISYNLTKKVEIN